MLVRDALIQVIAAGNAVSRHRPMHGSLSTVERAFELAREGRCRSVADIRRKLTAERHDRVEENLRGSAIQKQLRHAIAAAPAKTCHVGETT